MSNPVKALVILFGVIVLFGAFAYLVVITKGFALAAFILFTFLYGLYSMILEEVNKASELKKRMKGRKGADD